MTPTQKKFLILRSDGMTFDKIALELKTGKSTLISWSKLFQSDIEDMQFLAMQKIKEEYAQTQVQKYRQLMELLKKFDDGIKKANFTDEKIKDLYTIRNNIAFQINSMESKTIFKNTGLVETCEYTKIKSGVTMKLNEL